jgi:tetratricopeptide (TPR) repeat protein
MLYLTLLTITLVMSQPLIVQGQQRTPTRQGPMFLSGQVILDDGQIPGQQVRVELVCLGTVVRQEYTPNNGTFSIEVNRGTQDTLLATDASISASTYSPLGGGIGADPGGGAGLSNLSACELQARLPGYLSDTLPLGSRRAFDNLDVGVIVLHRLDNIEGGTISLKTLAAPEEARKAYEKAGKELRKKKVNLSKVANELEKAVEIYPEFAVAWHMLGEVLLVQKDRLGATEAFEQAKAADSHYVNPYLFLALMALEEKRWEQAARLSDQALKVSPQQITAHYLNAVANSSLGRIDYLNAVANSSLGRIDVAEESALQVQESSQAQNYPLIHYVLGWIMSQRGNFHSAAVEYRRFLEIQPHVPLAERLKEQLTQWQKEGLIQKPEVNN